MAVVGALTQDIEIRVNGAREANAQLDTLNKNLNEQGKAAGAADAGLRRTESAASRAGAAWSTFNRTASRLGEGLGKVTFAAQGLTTLIGGGMVGALGGALVALSSLIEELSDAGDATRVWTEETAAAKAGLTDIKAPLDAYAKSLGLVNAEMLTYKQRQDALRGIAGGGGAQTFDVLGQRAESLGAQIQNLNRALAMDDGSEGYARLRKQVAGLQAELDTLERAQLAIQRNRQNAKVVAAWAADGGAGVDETAGRGGSGGGTRPRAPRATRPSEPAPPGWLSGAVTSASDFAGRLYAAGEEAAKAAEAQAAREERIEQERLRLVADGVDARIAARRAEVTAEREMQAESRAQWGLTADASTASMGLISSAAQGLTATFGTAIANLIISGESGAKSLKKQFGGVLAGLSAQAFGYATLLGGLAAAAAFTGPILGLAAPGLLAGAGIMAGTGAALAVSARLLGADGAGGAGSARSSGGSAGRAAAPAAPVVPASAGGGGGTTNVFYLNLNGAIVGRGAEDEIHDMAARAEQRAQHTRGARRIAAGGR